MTTAPYAWLSKFWSSFVAILFSLVGVGRPGLVRRLREASLGRNLKRSWGMDPAGLVYSWQPISWVVVKLGIIGMLALGFYGLHPHAARLIGEAVDFLKLAEILGVAGSGATWPAVIAEWIFGGLSVLVSLPLALRTLAAGCTSVAFAPRAAADARRLIVYREFFFWRGMDAIPLQEGSSLGARQNLAWRVLGVGDLVLRRRDGAVLRLRSLWGVTRFLGAVK